MLAATAAVALVSWISLARSRAEGRTPQIVIGVLSAYSILFCAAATMGRTCTGMIEAHSSRYAAYKELAILSLFFWILTVRPLRLRLALSSVLPLLLIPSILVTAYDATGMAEFYN
ncbi:MAG: hypothetical protein WDO73_20445 [Ignavibacteriota bacterium]